MAFFLIGSVIGILCGVFMERFLGDMDHVCELELKNEEIHEWRKATREAIAKVRKMDRIVAEMQHEAECREFVRNLVNRN